MIRVFKEILDQFNKEINLIGISKIKSMVDIEKGMKISITWIQNLREVVLQGKLTSTEEEIYFFKYIKPNVMGYFLFFYYLQQIENVRPKGTIDSISKYLQKKVKEFESNLHNRNGYYYYYKSNDNQHDEQYFIRCNLTSSAYCYHPYSLLDSDFATSHDYLFADFKAHEMVIDYLSTEINKLHILRNNQRLSFKKALGKSPFNWTDNKIAVAELIYALVESGSINNGNVDINALAEHICMLFNIEDMEIYRAYVDIKNRKKNPVPFIDRLRENLLKRINKDFED
ncbi:MAG: RteC domain-containing protein [Carboxylicivirga sp.]|jgi:hypothetical protein|nr:RteC domain-containing protein [Carboxylicivirga sp.]